MSKTIFITGTSTGFGKLTALTLASAGHSVIAGMRNTKDKNAAAAEELQAVENIEVVDINITEARFDLDQLGQLAQHFVILGNLLVVAPIRDIAEELRHIAEQLFAFGVIVVPVQHAETGKGPLAIVKLVHFACSPGFCRKSVA